MFIVFGASGHIGSTVANDLLDAGEAVTVLGRDAARLAAFEARGARVETVNLMDTAALRKLIAGGTRLFILNPPAAPSSDTDVVERQSVSSILNALAGQSLEAIVAQSTYGAQPGTGIGDLGVLHALEQGLARQPIPFTINRGAYFVSNLDPLLPMVREKGVLQTFFPADLPLPIIAPQDLGHDAARVLRSKPGRGEIRFVEGPARVSFAEIATVLSKLLSREVRVETTPREKWVDTLRAMQFSDAAAESFAGMMQAAIDTQSPVPTHRGLTTIEAYLRERLPA